MLDIGKEFGNRIKKLRKEKGLTQEEVATGIQEKRSSYAEWEKGLEPKLSVIIKLSVFFKVGIEDLVFGLHDDLLEYQKSEMTKLKDEIMEIRGLLSETSRDNKKIRKHSQK